MEEQQASGSESLSEGRNVQRQHHRSRLACNFDLLRQLSPEPQVPSRAEEGLVTSDKRGETSSTKSLPRAVPHSKFSQTLEPSVDTNFPAASDFHGETPSTEPIPLALQTSVDTTFYLRGEVSSSHPPLEEDSLTGQGVQTNADKKRQATSDTWGDFSTAHPLLEKDSLTVRGFQLNADKKRLATSDTWGDLTSSDPPLEQDSLTGQGFHPNADKKRLATSDTWGECPSTVKTLQPSEEKKLPAASTLGERPSAPDSAPIQNSLTLHRLELPAVKELPTAPNPWEDFPSSRHLIQARQSFPQEQKHSTDSEQQASKNVWGESLLLGQCLPSRNPSIDGQSFSPVQITNRQLHVSQDPNKENFILGQVPVSRYSIPNGQQVSQIQSVPNADEIIQTSVDSWRKYPTPICPPLPIQPPASIQRPAPSQDCPAVEHADKQPLLSLQQPPAALPMPSAQSLPTKPRPILGRRQTAPDLKDSADNRKSGTETDVLLSELRTETFQESSMTETDSTCFRNAVDRTSFVSCETESLFMSANSEWNEREGLSYSCEMEGQRQSSYLSCQKDHAQDKYNNKNSGSTGWRGSELAWSQDHVNGGHLQLEQTHFPGRANDACNKTSGSFQWTSNSRSQGPGLYREDEDPSVKKSQDGQEPQRWTGMHSQFPNIWSPHDSKKVGNLFVEPDIKQTYFKAEERIDDAENRMTGEVIKCNKQDVPGNFELEIANTTPCSDIDVSDLYTSASLSNNFSHSQVQENIFDRKPVGDSMNMQVPQTEASKMQTAEARSLYPCESRLSINNSDGVQMNTPLSLVKPNTPRITTCGANSIERKAPSTSDESHDDQIADKRTPMQMQRISNMREPSKFNSDAKQTELDMKREDMSTEKTSTLARLDGRKTELDDERRKLWSSLLSKGKAQNNARETQPKVPDTPASMEDDLSNTLSNLSLGTQEIPVANSEVGNSQNTKTSLVLYSEPTDLFESLQSNQVKDIQHSNSRSHQERSDEDLEHQHSDHHLQQTSLASVTSGQCADPHQLKLCNLKPASSVPTESSTYFQIQPDHKEEISALLYPEKKVKFDIQPEQEEGSVISSKLDSEQKTESNYLENNSDLTTGGMELARNLDRASNSLDTEEVEDVSYVNQQIIEASGGETEYQGDPLIIPVSVKMDNTQNSSMTINMIATDPTAEKGQGHDPVIDQSVLEVKFERKLFTKTSSYEAAIQVLNDEGVVFLVGPPGCGKTMMARKLVRSLCRSDEKNQWQPLCLKKPSEWRRHVLPNCCQVILMEDIFGFNDFDKTLFDKWKMLNMEALQDLQTKRMIFTLRMHVYKEALPHLQTLPLFKLIRIVDVIQDLDDGKLSVDEKMKMLSKHLEFFKLKDKIAADIVKAVVSSETLSNFPTCCRYFCLEKRLHSVKDAVRFFTSPVEYFEKDIDLLVHEKSKVKFAVLLLTLVMKGQFRSDLMDDNDTSEIHEEFDCHMKAAGIPKSVTLASIKQCVKHLLGTYLEKKSDCVYVFCHQSVEDAILLVYGKIYPKYMLRICSLSFLHQYVKVETSSKIDKLKILLKPDDPHLIQRFVADIKKECPVHVCLHQALSREDFVSSFMRYCQENGKLDLLTRVSSNGQLPLLYWSIWSGCSVFFKAIFTMYVKEKKKLNQLLINQIANGCCVSNNVDVLKLLHRCLKTDLLRTPSVNIPIPLENTFASFTDITTGKVVPVGKLIHVACFNGSSAVVEFLLGLDSDSSYVNTQDDFGRTPSHIAAKCGHVEVFKTLLKYRCNLEVSSKIRNLPIHEACSGGEIEIVKMILDEHPRHLFVEGSEQCTPLDLAITNSHAKVVDWLLNLELGPAAHFVMGPKVHFNKETRKSPGEMTNRRKDPNWASSLIHLACTRPKNSQVLRMLCERLQNRKDEENYFLKICPKINTPLHVVCERTADVDMVKILIQFGVDVNATNVKHQTALHLACRSAKCSVRLVQTLIESKANAFVQDFDGLTALDYSSKNEKVKKYLEDIYHANTD